MPKTKKPKEKKNSVEWKHDDKIKFFLKKTQRKSEEEEASKLADEIGLPYLDLNIFPVDQENLRFIKEADARKYGLIVLNKTGRKVKLGVLDPQSKDTKKFIADLKEEEGTHFKRFVVSQSSIERAWENYKKFKLVQSLDLMRMSLSGDSLKEFENELKDLIDLEKKIRDVPTTKVLNIIVAGAIKMDASDVHFEPQRNGDVKLRYRIDGVLQTLTNFTGSVYPMILSRIKMLSGMMINVRDISQDGRFSIKLDEKNEIDVRVSILPGNYGESIVARLLSSDISKLTLENLGLKGIAYDQLMNQVEKKQGMILNSGPTGSGKTTTLYALMNKINTPDKKIITIENPVEYRLDGIVQTQIEAERGYTFANGLRAIVRQDPDILLVGEIRDEETAEIAIHSALTGHLVFSTVHANSSAGVIPRIIDLGIKPTLINSAFNGCIAQRLLRKLCPHCKEKYQPAKITIENFKKMLSIISPKAKVTVPKKIDFLWRAKGCPKCQGIGYKGRIGIFEILVINEEIKEKIQNLASEEEIMKTALGNGMVTMEQDGILKSLEGETSIEELQRVTGKGDYLLELYEKIMIQNLAKGVEVENKITKEVKEIGNDEIKLKEKLEKVSTKDIVRYVLSSGLSMRAGDIHIEPGEEEYKIRFRIDGVLQDIVKLPITEYLPLLNEIKMLSGFKIESRQGVVDGRFSIKIKDDKEEIINRIDVRVSIILGGFGDIIVMRLLNQSAQATKLEELKLNPINLIKLKEEIIKPNGIILNTGPTGSGKTTTLYSVLGEISKPENKVITVEDPIEYQMEGIIQTQVNKKEGYDFAIAMRSLLRQNPDIMMIGEIRDKETAQIAYQAALTGHLVLSTLHTNNAAGSVQRLVNMGLTLSDISSGTNCFIAQRLVRRLCPECKKKRAIKEEEKTQIKQSFNLLPDQYKKDIPPVEFLYEPVGCEKCHKLGYHGRLAIAEILQVNKEMEKYLITNPTTSEIQSKAVEGGMITMVQDGLIRALKGETTLGEIDRVAEKD
jgi:type IV pilus assembly protein PilB